MKYTASDIDEVMTEITRQVNDGETYIAVDLGKVKIVYRVVPGKKGPGEMLAMRRTFRAAVQEAFTGVDPDVLKANMDIMKKR